MIARRRGHQRRGLASLEFTLSFPLMLLFASAVLMVGRAGLARTSAGINARQQAWAGRSSAQPNDALSLAWDVAAAAQQRTMNKSYEGWVGGQRSQNAKSQHTVFAGSWDSTTVKFDPNLGPWVPHLAVMGKMGGSIGGGIGQSAQSAVTAITSPIRVMTSPAALAAGKAANLPVKAAGYYLEFTILFPLKAIKTAMVIANLNPLVSLGSEISVVKAMINSVEGLVEAAHERPGEWLPDKLKKISKVFSF